MGKPVKGHVDDDIYDRVLEEHNRTGKSKSQIVNERLRQAYDQNDASMGDGFLPVFGQSLFIVGFVIAFYTTLLTGLGVSFVGGGMIVAAKIGQIRMKTGVGRVEAFKMAMGI